jgi:HK97 family phage portal protein
LSIFDRLFKPKVTKAPAVPFLWNYGQSVPPDRDLKGYLNAYGEVGWLYAVVAKIAEGVADADWKLYSKSSKGDLTELPNHPAIQLLNFVNPFQTFQEFIELHQIYMELAGECFWVINKNKGGLPGEIWIAPPDKMSVVPSRKDFISGYVYQIGSEKMPLPVNDPYFAVIHHKLPNPTNPYRGLGAIQALAVDLDSELYAGKWNRSFFFNSARPDGIISFEDTLSEEQYDRLKKQWTERHGGSSNAHKLALLEAGGKYQQVSISAKDMDFKALRLLGRDNILGIKGIPLSVMGITENVNRANAEAGDYTFARWIITPRLKRLQGKLNEQYLPLFPNYQNLVLLPEDIIPESQEQKRLFTESGVKTGYMTINEARQVHGLEPLPEGDVLITPNQNPFGSLGLSVKRKAFTAEMKESYWRGYVTRAQSYENKMIVALKEMFAAQETEAIAKLNSGADHLLDLSEAKVAYSKLAEPILTDLFKLAVRNGSDLINPKPHKDAEELTAAARKWLLTRIAWAAVEIGEETARLLAEALAAGYAAGESIPNIAERVRGVFEDCSKRRSVLIARTETISASAQGAIEGYKEANIKQAEFMAAMDDRICEDCSSLDGEIFDIDDTTGVIPIHPDCRCVWLPVV